MGEGGWARLRGLVFGDSLGVALFLGAVCWLAITWRLGFFITDTYAVANTLVNVAEGHLSIEHIEYSLTLGSSQPGLHVHGGRVYGRNYGQVYLAVPAYWLLRGLSVVVDLRVVLTGAVSAAALGCAHQVGRVLGRTQVATVAGGALATVTFLGGILGAQSLPGRWAGLLALQATSLVAAAALSVVVYRLFGSLSGRRVGLAMGVASVVATPIGFWATVPKRHVLSACLIVATVALFYASRRRTDRTGRLARGGAYAVAGYLTSVHAGEGIVVLAVLLPVDLLTATRNGPRDVAAAAGGAAVGLAPFLVTNGLISGDPLLAPRWLASFTGGSIGPDGTVETAVQPVTAGLLAPLVTVVVPLAGVLDAVLGRLGETLAVVTDPQRLYHVFVRSGRIPELLYRKNGYAVIELTVLESMPLGWLALGAVGVAGRRLSWLVRQPGEVVAAVRERPARGTDLLVLGFAVALTASYLPELPLFSQITVRYLLPTMVLWLYAVGRLSAVSWTLTEGWHPTVASYALGLLGGGVGLLALFAVLDPALGEAMQLQALVNLGVGTGALGLVAAGTWRGRPAVGGVGLGLAGAAGTLLVAFLGLVYFQYGSPVHPLAERAAALLSVL